MGAPIRAYTRISSVPIKPYCQVTEPDVAVVLDATLLDIVDVTEGLKEDGVLLVNSTTSPDQVCSQTGYKGKVYTIDATSIAIEALGRNLPNVPMLGALARATGMVGKESLIHELRTKLGATMKQEVVAANVCAFERGYEDIKIS
jgi:pyruvate ferredoxin oxidoreductase gamma subunit